MTVLCLNWRVCDRNGIKFRENLQVALDILRNFLYGNPLTFLIWRGIIYVMKISHVSHPLSRNGAVIPPRFIGGTDSPAKLQEMGIIEFSSCCSERG